MEINKEGASEIIHKLTMYFGNNMYKKFYKIFDGKQWQDDNITFFGLSNQHKHKIIDSIFRNYKVSMVHNFNYFNKFEEEIAFEESSVFKYNSNKFIKYDDNWIILPEIYSQLVLRYNKILVQLLAEIENNQ